MRRPTKDAVERLDMCMDKFYLPNDGWAYGRNKELKLKQMKNGET